MCDLEENQYIDLFGEVVTVDTMEWLEDGSYWEYGVEFDEDGYETGEYRSCSRYYIGIDESGDSQSVWLNDEMREVTVE